MLDLNSTSCTRLVVSQVSQPCQSYKYAQSALASQNEKIALTSLTSPHNSHYLHPLTLSLSDLCG